MPAALRGQSNKGSGDPCLSNVELDANCSTTRPKPRRFDLMKETACEKCGKLYRIDLSGIKTEMAKMTCKACGTVNLIMVNAPPSITLDGAADLPERSRKAAAPSSSLAGIGFGQSLKMQINALIICIVVVIMGGYAWYTYSSAKNNMQKELQYAADITAERLSKHLREPFWGLDDSVLSESLSSEMLDRRIYAINILDRDGQSIYMGFKRGQDWQATANQFPLSGDYTVRRMDIVRDQDKIGAVQVYLSDKFMKADFQRAMITIVIIVAILVLAIVLLVSFIFQKLVIRPIANLAGLADRISMGDLNVDVPVLRKNEIGLLAQSFDRLKTSLKIGMEAMGANR